jgi:hypothetical protein
VSPTQVHAGTLRPPVVLLPVVLLPGVLLPVVVPEVVGLPVVLPEVAVPELLVVVPLLVPAVDVPLELAEPVDPVPPLVVTPTRQLAVQAPAQQMSPLQSLSD